MRWRVRGARLNQSSLRTLRMGRADVFYVADDPVQSARIIFFDSFFLLIYYFVDRGTLG